MSNDKTPVAGASAPDATHSRESFLQALDLYLAELGEDPCFDRVRQYYAHGPASRSFRLDRWGNPAGQLRADARAGGGEFLAETAEAIERAPVLAWRRGMDAPKGRYRPDHFGQAAARVVGAFGAQSTEEVVVTLAEGVKRGLEGKQKQLVEDWWRDYRAEFQEYRAQCLRTGVKGYKELSLFTLVGFAGGLGLGALLDALGFSASAIGEWAVRTLSGEGEDLGEGAWLLRRRLRRKNAQARGEAREEEEKDPLREEGLTWFEEGEEGGAAEAYGAGKIVGMALPWAVDGVSRLAGVDVRAPEGSYVAYLYSLADQIFATISGFRFHARRAGSFLGGLKGYFRDPVMVSSLTVITVPFLLLYWIRAAGWRPHSLLLAAVEGVLLNLCWVPPVTAWFWDRRLQRGLRRVTETYAARARTESWRVSS